MNDDRLFLITGATGNTGQPTAGLLLGRGHRVRALVHREDDRYGSSPPTGPKSSWVTYSTSMRRAAGDAGSERRLHLLPDRRGPARRHRRVRPGGQ